MPTVPVERAADSPEEFALVCGIADHPTDDTRRLVYADWLEERGDRRGPVLRAFMEALAADEPPPEGWEDFPRAWCDVVGVTLRAEMADAGIYNDAVFALARPAILLVADPDPDANPGPVPDALGTTRLGGPADLPAGSEVPGRELVFIGQFDLADLGGTVAGRQFPGAGLLSLFGHQYDGSGAAVLTPPGTPLVRVAIPGEYGPSAPRANLRLVETLRLPALYGDRGTELGIGAEEMDHLDDFLDESHPAADMLGGHPVADHTGYDVLHENPGWVQLAMFTLAGGWMWSDGHNFMFALPADDLKAGDLGRVEAIDG